MTSTEVDLPEAIARPWTYETDPRGTLGLLADRHTKVLVGVWAVAPPSGRVDPQSSTRHPRPDPTGNPARPSPVPTYSELGDL